jgi:organic hydroperoxide reductase OsmC/OhrA
VVTDYVDEPEGLMEEASTGGGKFLEVILKPTITITDASKAAMAIELHAQANSKCFIANSVNFPVHHLPKIQIL